MGKRIIWYIIGVMLFAIGCKCFVDSNLGTDPLDVLLIGLQKHTGLLLGHLAWGITFLLIGIYALLSHRLPHWTSFITAPICGYLLDAFNYLLPKTTESIPILLIPALIGCSAGSALILASRYGVRIMDLVVIASGDRTGLSFGTGKVIIEVLLLLTGWILGGPFGIATILFVLLVGPLVELFTRAFHPILGTPREIKVYENT